MTAKLDEMWAALEACQPKADKDGHGESWRVMCEKRTPSAIWAAHKAAPAGSAGKAAAWAAEAAAVACAAALAAAAADADAQQAIDAIKEAQP